MSLMMFQRRKHSLQCYKIRSTAKDNIHQNQVNSLQSRVQEAARLQQELQAQLEQAQVNGQNAAQQSHVDGRRKAHLLCLLLLFVYWSLKFYGEWSGVV